MNGHITEEQIFEFLASYRVKFCAKKNYSIAGQTFGKNFDFSKSTENALKMILRPK